MLYHQNELVEAMNEGWGIEYRLWQPYIVAKTNPFMPIVTGGDFVDAFHKASLHLRVDMNTGRCELPRGRITIRRYEEDFRDKKYYICRKGRGPKSWYLSWNGQWQESLSTWVNMFWIKQSTAEQFLENWLDKWSPPLIVQGVEVGWNYG